MGCSTSNKQLSAAFIPLAETLHAETLHAVILDPEERNQGTHFTSRYFASSGMNLESHRSQGETCRLNEILHPKSLCMTAIDHQTVTYRRIYHTVWD